MSAAPSFRLQSITSETDDVVARCLAEVRAAANLDDVPVLDTVPKRIKASRPMAVARPATPPPLPTRSSRRPPPLPLPRRATPPPPVPRLSSPPIPRLSAPPLIEVELEPLARESELPAPPKTNPRAKKAVPAPAPSAARAFEKALPTVVIPRKAAAPSSRSAVLACGFVALVAAVFAVVLSPLQHRAPVARTVTVTTAAVHQVAQITLDVLRFGER